MSQNKRHPLPNNNGTGNGEDNDAIAFHNAWNAKEAQPLNKLPSNVVDEVFARDYGGTGTKIYDLLQHSHVGPGANQNPAQQTQDEWLARVPKNAGATARLTVEGPDDPR